MSAYEHIVISAVRYAIGRMSYIANITVDYVLKDIAENKLSKKCLSIIKSDIKNGNYLGMYCDQMDWKRLLNKIEEVIK